MTATKMILVYLPMITKTVYKLFFNLLTKGRTAFTVNDDI